MPPLPYDITPPPEPPSELPELMTNDPPKSDVLDKPLDDYRPVVPEHVQDLMSRMSKGKVYLLEDTPAIIHVDVDQRIRGDPRIALLAEQLDAHDPTDWLNVVSVAAPSPIRHNALYIRSDLIKHLSTSKIFSWVTSLGTAVMGIEWLNDTTLNLLFPSAAASLLALTLLSKAGFDPAEGDDPLLERAAHAIPVSLLVTADMSLGESRAGEELLGEPSIEPRDGIQRKGRGGFHSGIIADSVGAEVPVAPPGWVLEDGIDPNARVTVRFAVESDQELRRQAPHSEWYAKNGRRAGKEVVERKRATPYDRPDPYEEAESSWGRDEGRDLGRRLGRGRGGRGGRRANNTVDDLDRELEGLRGDGRSRRGDNRRPRRKEDLDKELDDMFASTS